MQYSDENIPNSCRVKLYQLESEGNWLDQGTGFVACSPLQSGEAPRMIISREEDSAMLLQSRIVLDDVYERQGESIIMWRETGAGWGQDIDYAISFQDSSGCFSVWEYICFVREHYRSDDENFYEDQSLMIDHEGGLTISSSRSRTGSFELPVVSLETLPDIIDLFAFASSNGQQKRVAAQYIVGHRYDLIHNLVALSADLAEKEDFAACARISDLMKQVAYLNDLDIINYLVSDDAFLHVARVWEYDGSLRCKENYSAYLSSPSATPKQALSAKAFADGNDLINFLSIKLFRLKYMKDVMLRPLIDEGGAGALANAVQMTTMEICERVFSDQAYVAALLAVIECPPVDTMTVLNEPFSVEITNGAVRNVTIATDPPDEKNESPTAADEDQTNELKRSGSGFSTSTLSTVSLHSAASTLSPPSQSSVPSPASTLPEEEEALINASEAEIQAKVEQSTVVSSSPSGNSNHNSYIEFPSRPVCVREISGAIPVNTTMKRMIVARNSACPHDPLDSQADTRGACLKFLRELFGLSRNLAYDKRAELYTVFILGVKNAFFNAMLEVLRCGPSIEWVLALNSEDPVSVNNGFMNGQELGEGHFMSRDEFCAAQEERDTETYHRLCAIDILSTLTCVCPNPIRSFILEGPTPKPITPGALLGGVGVLPRNCDNCEEKYPTNGVVVCDPSSVAAVLAMRKHNSKCLLYVIIARLLAETNEMIMEHIGDILHSILDPECRTDAVADRERFAVAVNDCYCPWLVVCFLEPYKVSNAELRDGQSAALLGMSPFMKPYLNAAVYYSSMRIITEALCFCCTALGYRIKYFIIRNLLVNKVFAVLLGSGQKVVYLHGIKFLFSVVKMKDDMNFKQWVKLDVLRPLFELLASLSGRDNLILSAVIELVDYIRSEGIKILIEYIVEKHADSFANVVYQGDTFEKLSTKYSQIKDAEDDTLMRGGSAAAAGYPQNLRESVESGRRLKFVQQDSEESYFQEDDEDDEEERSKLMGTLLSAYRTDDDDDDEIGPMPVGQAKRSISTDDETGLSVDMFGDNTEPPTAESRQNLKKRRLSSIGGYASSGPPEKLRIVVGNSVDDTKVVVSASGEGQKLKLSSPFKDSGAHLVDEDAAPPLPPLRSKYDSSSDEEGESGGGTGSGEKSLVDSLFRRGSSSSSSTASTTSTSGRADEATDKSAESSKGGLFSFSLKKKTVTRD